MKITEKLFSIFLVLIFIITILDIRAQELDVNYNPKTLTELKNSIQKVLEETDTPGAGIALLKADEII